MYKKFILLFMIYIQCAQPMEKNQVVGTLLLTGAYYSLIHMYHEQYKSVPTFKKRDCLLGLGIFLQTSGLAALSPSILKSTTPVQTGGKYLMGSLSLAHAAYFIHCAKQHNELFNKDKNLVHQKERNQLLCASLLCTAFGSSMITWAIQDTN